MSATGLTVAAPGRIGLGSYAFFWQRSDRVAAPLSPRDMLDRTADAGIAVFQFCDDPAVDALDDAGLEELAAHARHRSILLELGTRGVREPHLARYLHMARVLDARLVRSMLNAVDDRPSADEAVAALRAATRAYAEAGVTLALETYEQVPTRELLAIVERVDSPALGVCLDPANVVAALEQPRDVVELTAPHVVNLHVKDFRFSRNPGWVGFVLAGAPLGEGALDLDHELDTVMPRERGINQIVEHWLPWQGSAEATVAMEQDWTARTIEQLRERGMS
jgi:3-oxoisoapionate decarboxylase